ncbi:hypothetical protein [Nocardia tengchongensis]|uniref:hypothetical protein n=1 Tax=Nocardia tengchongensis TaxID=2055889 RepID=UPI003656CB8A
MTDLPIAEAQRLTRRAFTDIERALLLTLTDIAANFLSTPAWAAADYRRTSQAGGGHGFDFRFTSTAVVGTWHKWEPVSWRDNGEPTGWRSGAVLATAKIRYRRLQQWSESLPAAVREQASTWACLYPVDTHDYAALSALTITLLTCPAPQRVADHEPADLLELLAMANP